MEFLTDKERRILESLYKCGQSMVSDISKDTLMNRTALYHTVESLIKKGLITKVEKNKISYFEAIPIDQLEIWAKGKLEDLKSGISADIKSFSSIKKEKSASLYTDVKYFEGFEAIKNLYTDTLYNNKENHLYSITDYEKGYDTLGKWVTEEYLPERVRRGIRVKNILPDGPRGRSYVSSAKELLRDMCFVDLTTNFGIEINLYDEKIAMVSFDKKYPLGVIIQNKIISTAFRNMFDCIWKTGEVVAE